LARRVDEGLTRRALAAVARAAKKAADSPEGLTEWEGEFLESVETRLKTYGSAFADPDKGQLSSPLSLRQGLKLRQISRKGDPVEKPTAKADGARDKPAKPQKARKPLARKTPLRAKPKPR
jgi:hypothetical protein